MSLEGIRVAITRASHQADEQRLSLESQGATVFHYPTIAIAPPSDIEVLDAAVERALSDEYDWLIVTSSNTVFALAERLRTLGMSWAGGASMRVAAVGASTAKAVETQLGLSVAATPAEFTAVALGQAIRDLNRSSVFLPQSAIADSNLVEILQAAGATVDAVSAYRTVAAQGGDDVTGMLWEGSIDAITFTSASTVRNFARRLSVERASLAMLDNVCVACIGPSTAAAARQFGLTVDVMPTEHTIEGMTRGLINYFRKEEPNSESHGT